MFSRHQLKHYKEIVDRHLVKSNPNYINVEREFRETWERAAAPKNTSDALKRAARDKFANVVIKGVPLQMIVDEANPREQIRTFQRFEYDPKFQKMLEKPQQPKMSQQQKDKMFRDQKERAKTEQKSVVSEAAIENHGVVSE